MEKIKEEVRKLQAVGVERDKRIRRLDHMFSDMVEIKTETSHIKEILEGKEGGKGLQDSVDRLVLLIDGDKKFGVVGLMGRMESMEGEIAKLVIQRTQIKWAVMGVLFVTTLGNANGILTFAKMVLFP